MNKQQLVSNSAWKKPSMILIRREIHWGMNTRVLILLSFKGITPKITEIIRPSHFPFVTQHTNCQVLMNILLHSWPAKTLYYFFLDKYLTLGINYFHHFLQHFVLRAEHRRHKAPVTGASIASYGWAWLLSDRAFLLEEHSLWSNMHTHIHIRSLISVLNPLQKTEKKRHFVLYFADIAWYLYIEIIVIISI